MTNTAALTDDSPAAVAATKAALRRQLGDPRAAFAAATADIEAAVGQIVAERESLTDGESVIPTVDFADVAADRVAAPTRAAITRKGCVVVRQTFPRAQAVAWDQEVADYLDCNDFASHHRPVDDGIFAGLAAGTPPILDIYWSRPQLEVRAHPNMGVVQSFLNSFWRHESEGRTWFDPTGDAAYPDRVRRRPPGTASAGLSPHTDSGSVERWLLPAYQQVFRHVFSGDWEKYDPWDGAYRTDVDEFPSTVMCSAFRTFQGWTALSDMHPRDGVLHVIPVPRAMGFVLLRALQDDIADDDLCGARNGRALAVEAEHHELLLPAYSPIPEVESGDTVWWIGDLVHGVGEVSGSERWGNVMYIPAAPWCHKNAAYARQCGQAFLAGHSPGDFSPQHYEADFADRATLADLDPLTRRRYALA
ncbi:DUF1479 family protein [soil metagenome]